MNGTVVTLFSVIFVLCVNADVQIRRDENWPPEKVLAVFKPIHEICVKKTGVTEEAITTFSDTRDNRNDNDEKLKCYMACLLDETHVLDSNRRISIDKIIDSLEKLQLSPEDNMIYMKMGLKCTKVPKLTKDLPECERAFRITKCWKTSDPVNYSLV